MKFIIRGQKVEITDAIRSYIEEKIGRLEKYFNAPDSLTATVVARIRGNSQIVEVTIPTHNAILRCEVESDDLYASIDLVSDKLERQIRKNKTRIASNKKKEIRDFAYGYIEEIEDEETEEKVVKRKKIDLKPMSEEEAILQMELLGHAFYLYKDAETNNPTVVYKRKDGGYGIIEA